MAGKKGEDIVSIMGLGMGFVEPPEWNNIQIRRGPTVNAKVAKDVGEEIVWATLTKVNFVLRKVTYSKLRKKKSSVTLDGVR